MEQSVAGEVVGFSLENYHVHLAEFGLDHHEFIKKLGRKVPSTVLDMAYFDNIIEIANNDLVNKFRIYNDNIEFRVVRPGNDDNNDLHRDHWFPYFTPLVNIYLPLTSSYYDSAMGIVPFSHNWSEDDVVPTFTYAESSRGKKHFKNGVYYSVPAVKSCAKVLNLHRPDLTRGDFMLFSPKMVHGGGSNSSRGTRFSFEVRLESLDD
ncbi:phytanoyl-CoA dioxygenase family protein [Pseudomonadales bacterium]|nr:phytanoyl-CoA dioxygenase family protein [Pseudomonadales bacterium]